MKHALLMSALLPVFGNSYSQSKITKIYTDFGNFWTSDSAKVNGVWSSALASKVPNTSHNLLAFRVGADSVFSTGVNDDLLTAKGISFFPINFRALPVTLSSRVGGSYFIGVGSFYGGHSHSAATQPVPQFTTPDVYLKDGTQGLDLGTALFNIPDRTPEAPAKVPVSYQIDQFNISRIGDKIPDIMVTQMGEPSSGTDSFRFVDVNGNTVGSKRGVSFSGSDTLGLAFWAYYNASNGNYVTSQPGNPSNTNRNTRAIRMVQWDLIDFGLNANNIGNVVRFEHILSGNSDPAFVAYNTSSFRALSVFDPGCQTSVKAPVWLQANRGVTANASNRVTEWRNDGGLIVNAIQTTPAQAPVFQNANLAGTNFRPFLRFNSGNNFLNQNTSPFTPTGNFDIYVVARPTQNSGSHRIVGFQNGAGSSFDFASLWLNSSGQLEFRNDNTTPIVTGASPGINKTGIWRITYTRDGKISISLNGGTPIESATNQTLALPIYNTQYGNNTSAFDLGEIMFYGANLNPSERQRVQSYLSVKYGIHYASDFISGTDGIIWDQANGGYSNNVFGIGREDCMGLAQKQSHSITASTGNNILQIGLDAMATTNSANNGNIPDAHYIIWGDNNASLTPTQNIKADKLCLTAPQRTWRSQTTGNLANTLPTQVRIETQGIWSSVATADNYFLLLDRDGNGVYDDAVDTAIPASSMNGSVAVFNNIIWDKDNSSVDLFTIGLRQAAPDAGLDQTLSGTAFQLGASPQSGLWTVQNTSPAGANVVIANANQHNSSVTVPNGVTATMRWTVNGLDTYCYDEVVLNNTAPLPVQMKYFNATAMHGQVELDWSTLQEHNNKGFNIERSADGKTFEVIGFVAGKDEASQYTFTDKLPLAGLNFYRLQQLDFDEQYSYSDVRFVRMTGANTLVIAPNPVKNKISILGIKDDAQLLIYTADGQVKFKGVYGSLDVAAWAPGLYLIQTLMNGTVQTAKFIKE